MKLNCLLPYATLCALVLSTPNIGHCELIQTINIRLIARITTASGTSTNGDTYLERMKSIRITTKDVLDMLGKATTNDFHGATLVSVHRGVAYQVRRGTNVLADVSGFFTDDGASDDVIDQDFNGFSGKDNYHGFWLKGLTFNDQQGNQFTLNGMIEEHYKANVADSNGMQHISDLEIFNGMGEGTLQTSAAPDGQYALYSGTIILSGKGVVPLNTF